MRYLLELILISLVIGCGRDMASDKEGAKNERDFAEFLKTIPNHSLPLELSCGLPNETNSVKEFEIFNKFIPKSIDKIFGEIENNTEDLKLIIYGQTGDDIYPIIFSFDNKGAIKDSLFLILKGCGGADEYQIPHSFVTISKDLTITLTDTTQLIHFPKQSKSVDDFVVDSLRISKVLIKVSKDGKFVKQ